MKVPLSWLKDFVEIDLPLPELAYRLTMAGLEVEEIRYVGLPVPEASEQQRLDARISGLAWDREKIVVGEIREVMPHPNADRLVLCRLYDGQQEHTVLTGAPNLFEYKGRGPLPQPLKVAYAREGAQIYDGHQPGQVLTTLKRARIRGVESYSMACSEKELGISDDHEGIILFDADAPVGMPLADYIGDAVLDIAILPSTARCASILGVAREVAALTGKPLRWAWDEQHAALSLPLASTSDFATVEITNPELNPRFLLGLIRNVTIGPSPYKVQLRLKLAGMRPINNIVDATNYVMLELGEPLHAFDYDVLRRRAGGKAVHIITRTARPGEKLTTLDGVERTLDETTVLVCDTSGPLSIAGVMGGAESEVSPQTTSVLLEGATWNYINIRKTARAQNLISEASYRFARGVHPAMAERGVRRALTLMAQWAGGELTPTLVDNYPLPPKAPVVTLSPADVRRWLGIDLSAQQIVAMLERLEFRCEVRQAAGAAQILITPPDHRLDIGEGITGKADVIEEIARLYGYERIPETRLADELPPQIGNPLLEKEERVRDLLVAHGLQEVVNYRLTTPEREARCLPLQEGESRPYVRLLNPISSDKVVLRRSVLASVLENAEHNARLRQRLALFEIGPAFLPVAGADLPEEQLRLAIVLAGPRLLPAWQKMDEAPLDFYDLKGILEGLFAGLHLPPVQYEPTEHPTFHPGKCARLVCEANEIGLFGELHPQIKEHYDWPVTYKDVPILAADLDLSRLLQQIPALYETAAVPEFPPVLEDLAVVVEENLPAGRVANLIRQAGGKVVADVRLFDVYRGEKIGAGKKSLAYRVTYQAADKTLNDQEVAAIRARIVRRLEQELGAALRQ
jgi:phenylalanyl-tRNA synthetase beta chain